MESVDIMKNGMMIKKSLTLFLFALAFMLLHSFSAIANEKGIGETKKEEAIALQDPLSFVLPLPTIPSTINVGDTVVVTYTIRNNVSTAFFPISTKILNASGVQIFTVITRIDIGVGNDCGIQGHLLGPLQQCTITLQIQPTTPGPQSYTLVVDYGGRQPLTSGISFSSNALPGFAYITNSSGSPSVTFCKESAGGLLGNCGDPGVTGVSDPAGIAVQEVSATPYEYIVNKSGGTVTKCTLDETTGAVTGSCSTILSGLAAPVGIAFQTIDSILYGYVVDSGAPGITECTVSTMDGSFSSCSTEIPTAFDMPFGIGIATSIGSTDYAYVTDVGTSSVTKCAIDATSGELLNCFDSGVGAVFDLPQDIAFSSLTNPSYAYVTDSTHNTTGTVWQCTVNSITGNLSACASTGSGFDNPLGITVATVGSSRAYITNTSGDSITECTIGAGGVPGSCSNTASHNTVSPAGLAYATFGGDHYTYIVNLTGTVFQCRITSPSGLMYCIDSGVGHAFSAPKNIAFETMVADLVTYEFAYVTDPGVHEVTQCTADQTTGLLSACQNAGPLGLEAPFDLTFATSTISGVLYAYISVPTFQAIFQCVVDVDGSITGGQIGALCNCTDAGKNITPPYVAPTGVSFQTFMGVNYVYLVDETHSAAYRCTLDSSGLFTACINENVSSLNSPQAIVFQTVNANDYAYITNTRNFLMVCPVDASGAFGTCTESSMQSPSVSISFDVADNKAYVTFNVANTVQKCDVSTVDGSLSACISAFGDPSSVAIETISGPTQVAYILQNGGSGIELCQLNQSTGHITSCADAGPGFYFAQPFIPSSMAFSPAVGDGPFVYVTNTEGSGSVTVCTWDSADGAISSCMDSGAAFNFGKPTSISFDIVSGTLYAYVVDETDNEVIRCTVNETSGTLSACVATSASTFDQPEGIAFSGNQAYITDAGLNQVLVCEQESDGTLAFCADSGVGAVFSDPSAIAFSLADVGSVPNAYITNQTAVSMEVSQCVLSASTGFFVSCGDSGADNVSDTTSIAFGTIDGSTYGYITNFSLNSVTMCSFNTTTGQFSACGDSGAGTIFSGPAGIAFLNP